MTMSISSIQEFHKHLYLNKDDLVKIGEGGMGKVYFDSSYPDRLFKISKSNIVCKDWGREYKTYHQIQSNNAIGTDNVTVLQMYDFQTFNGTGCILELERVVNPINSNLTYTIQPVFGILNQDSYTEGRGRYLGVNNLIKQNLLTYESIKTICYDLGITLGELHYEDKIDGIDLELFLGYTFDDNNLMVFIGDFDQASSIDPRGKGSINTLVTSIDAFPYFPNLDQTPDLYSLFKDGYLKIGQETGYLDIAKKVLELYE